MPGRPCTNTNWQMFGMGAVILSLGVAYWLINQSAHPSVLKTPAPQPAEEPPAISTLQKEKFP